MNELPQSFRRLVVLTCFICGVAWWLTFSLTTGLTKDDALITYRYAENIASGNGFVFNAGEHVLGTSTPLLTLFLAAVGTILGPEAIPRAATLTMGGFGILAGILIYCILVELRFSLLTCILSIPLFFGSHRILVMSVGGMETPLVLFCMAASHLAYLRRRSLACLLILAILILTRPDGIIWAAVMGLAVVLQLGKIPWKSILIAVSVVLPWIVFATWYFGSPLPHSIVAKQTIGSSASLPPALSLAGLTEFTLWYLTGSGVPVLSGLILPWLFVLALGAASYLRHDNRRGAGVVLAAYLLLYGLFLYAGRAPHFEWYLVPALLCSLLFSAPGVTEFGRMISERLPEASERLRVGPAIAVVLVACLCFAQNYGTLESDRQRQAYELQLRAAIGFWLRDNTPRESTVAMEAVGYQAFYSHRTIIDLAGIVSPRVVALRKESSSNAETFFKILSELRPDYVVLRSFEVDNNQHFHGGRLFDTEEQREYFENNYMERQRFVAPYPERWGILSFMTIYARSPKDR